MQVHIACVLAAAVCWCQLSAVVQAATPGKIDRHALVTRHNPRFRNVDPMSPLSVGNGELASTAHMTGLQTFPEFLRGEGSSPRADTISLGTPAQWG